MNDTVTPAQLVLCVPGPWADRSQFLEHVIEGTGGQYLFAGRVLMHVASQQMFEVEFAPRDGGMLRAFQAAGPHWRDSPDMARIDTHAGVFYLFGRGGSGR